MSKLAPGLVGAAVWFAVALLPRVGLAQSEADRATARNLAAEGYTALKTSDYGTAEDRFRRADALVHAPTLVVDHARALIGLGRFVEAHERLELVLREGVPSNAPSVWKKSLEDAQVLLREVKPKIAWLTINVVGPEGVKVTVDGVEVPSVALGVRRATDPGQRRVRATAEGYLAREVPLGLPEGGERAISIELSRDPEAAASSAKPEAPAVKATLQVSVATSSRSRIWTYAAFGASGAGVVVGAVTGAIALNKRSKLLDACPSRKNCDPEYSDVNDQYLMYGTASGIGWTVGVVGGAVGLWLLLSDPGESEGAPKRAAFEPYVTTDSVGLAGVF